MLFKKEKVPPSLSEREVQVALGTEETCCADCIYPKVLPKDILGSNTSVTVCTAVEQEKGRDRITGEPKWNNAWKGWERYGGWTTNKAFQFSRAVEINDGHCKHFKQKTTGKQPRKKIIEVPVYVCIFTVFLILFLVSSLFWSRTHG